MKRTNLIKSITSLSLSVLPISSICLLSSCATIGPKIAYADILTANDIHGAIDQSTVHPEVANRAPAIECLLNEYLKVKDEDKNQSSEQDPTYMLLNGDIVQGNNMTVFSDNVGEWIWDILGCLPYEYSSIGNHETDWGINHMADNFSEMGHLKWLCCNITLDENGQVLANTQRYSVVKVGGLNVGLVGYTSPDVDNQPWEISKDYRCSDARDGGSGTLVLQNAINDCRNNSDPTILNGEKPDVVFLLAHAGAFLDTSGDPDPDNPKYGKKSEIFNVIHNINGIDGCLSSHSHFPYVLQVKDKDGKNIPTGQAEWHSESLLQTKITYDKNNKKDFKVSMSLRPTHTEKTFDQLEYKDSSEMQTLKSKYSEYSSKVSIINDAQTFVVKANNQTDINDAFVKSKTFDGYGEIPVLGNILTKTMVKTLTKERIRDDESATNPFIQTRDEMVKCKWFEDDNQFNGLDFYMEGDDTTQSAITPSISIPSVSPYGAAFSYGDITKTWKYQQVIYIIKMDVKDLKAYYLDKNCNKKSNSYNIVDPIYSDKYILKYNGPTIAKSTKIKLVNKTTGAELQDDDIVYVGTNSFIRDNRAKDYFAKYAPHDLRRCVTVTTDWEIIHPATHNPFTLDGYYGNAFGFIYSVRLLGGYDKTNPNNPMIDLTDASSMYKFDPSHHYAYEDF